MGFYQCDDCIFGTNSPKSASRHEDETGHTTHEEDA